MTQEVIGSAWSSEVRRWRLEHSGGRWERMSDAAVERESAAGQTNLSGRKGSDGGEEWECAGGVEERETCSDSRDHVQFNDSKKYHYHTKYQLPFLSITVQ